MLSLRLTCLSFSGLIAVHAANAAEPEYIQLIVKACPAIEITGQENKPDAVMGYYAEPINQGRIYDNERSPTKAERESYFATLHCIDVPIPAAVTMLGDSQEPMTMAQCIGHRGYLTAMQFLEQEPAYRQTHPAVGAWNCIAHDNPVEGVTGM